MDAGISQKYLIAAVCIGVREGENDQLILNPNLDELNECVSNLTFVLDNQDYKLISFIHEGGLSIDLFDRALQLAKQSCEDVFKFYKESIRSKFIKKNNEPDGQTNEEMVVE